MKYIFITGGVVSSLGKGLTAAALGTLLEHRGLKVVLDCAHGATYQVAPKVFAELGAEVVAIGDKPDGFNINSDVGSTHPQALQQAATRRGSRPRATVQSTPTA